jgi:RHS repeat-associated protein
MSNDAGTVAEGPYTYDAYGQGAPSTGVPFKYTGRRLDPETGLYYYRARYYSAALGRFLQTDPIGYGAGLNSYSYASHDPTNRSDATGLTDVNLYDHPSEVEVYRKIGNRFDIPGMYTIGAHGNKSTPYQSAYILRRKSSRDDAMGTAEVAQQINANAPRGQDVFIMACHYGRSGAALEVSAMTDHAIWAPTAYVWASTRGTLVTMEVAEAIGNDSQRGIDRKRPGVWKEFRGGRATLRTIEKVTWDTETDKVEYEIRPDPRSIDKRIQHCSGTTKEMSCH